MRLIVVHDFISLFLKLLIKVLITDIKDYKNILKVKGIHIEFVYYYIILLSVQEKFLIMK